MREIDLATWDRAVHFQVFRNRVQPHYCVSFDLDITKFRAKVKEKGFSFTFSFMYAVTKCADQIENFRYRFVNGKPVIFDTINTSVTYLNKETELFKVVNIPMQSSLDEYVTLAKHTEENQSEYFTTSGMGNDIYQFSPLPWISFTHISNTDTGDKESATPIFHWGKYYERDGKILMPFSVQVHHAFVDGLHVGKLAQILQEYLDTVV